MSIELAELIIVLIFIAGICRLMKNRKKIDGQRVTKRNGEKPTKSPGKEAPNALEQ